MLVEPQIEHLARPMAGLLVDDRQTDQTLRT